MSSILDALSTIVSDPDLTSATGKDEAATELKKVQASFYDSFDKLMDASKRLTAIYHSMLEMHKFCAQMLKRCLALGQPNSVRVQRIQAQKAQIEQNMIEIVSIQSENMRAIELLHDGSKRILWDRLGL